MRITSRIYDQATAHSPGDQGADTHPHQERRHFRHGRFQGSRGELDLFEHLNKGSIILVDTAKNFLKGLIRRLTTCFGNSRTRISEEAGPAATIDGLMSVAPYFRIAPAHAGEMLGEVERAVAGWRKQGKSIGMTETELDQFADAFEHEEREVARKIAR